MSVAEERIRLKAEAALRDAFPDARIIHELVVRQGGCRIDLAAVTPHRIVAVEVKSERDVLTRLERQLRETREVADGVLVVVAEKHLAAGRKVAGWSDVCAEDFVAHELGGYFQRRVLGATTNAPARLNMLWASELRIVAEAPAKATRTWAIQYASDGLTGAEVRKRVCAALRAREFPRADPPCLCDLFPVATRFT